MGLMTADEYRSSLDDGRQVWLGGQRVAQVATHPAFRPMVDAVARIYGLHFDPETRGLMTFALPDGTRASRFFQIPRSAEDLRLRRLMGAAILGRISPTMDRFGDETVTPLFVMQDREALVRAHDPRTAGTGRRWLARLQERNLFMSSGNTDPKGDRSRQPSEQGDPDMFLRVVRETDEGIVIRGAKFETGAAYAHVAFLKPTVGTWNEANRDYAVACIARLNAPGVRHICRMPLSGGDGGPAMEGPLSRQFDEIDSLVVFDDVLIPWEDVVFSRQPELARMLRADFSRWSGNHFLVRTLAKADLLVGAALLAAEQAGTIGFPAVRAMLSQLMAFKSGVEAFLLAGEAMAETTVSGFVMPNQAIQNAGRMYCTQTYHEMLQILVNIAGGQAVMLPDQAMFDSVEIGADVRKYYATGRSDAAARMQVLHLVQDLTASGYAGRMRAYQLFAETPLAAQENALFETYDRAGSVARAQALIDRANAPAAPVRLAAE